MLTTGNAVTTTTSPITAMNQAEPVGNMVTTAEADIRGQKLMMWPAEDAQ